MEKVFLSGTFDILNVGHINFFKRAKAYGHVTVGLNTGELSKKYKGYYPVIPYSQRETILKSIKYIDKVIPKNELSCIKILKEHEITLYILTTGESKLSFVQEEIDFIKNLKGRIRVIPYTDGISSTIIKEKIYKSFPKVYAS